MRKTIGIKVAAAVALTAMLGSTVSSPLAQAADKSPRMVAAGSGLPALVDPGGDLGAKPPGPEESWADSIYFGTRATPPGSTPARTPGVPRASTSPHPVSGGRATPGACRSP